MDMWEPTSKLRKGESWTGRAKVIDGKHTKKEKAKKHTHTPPLLTAK